MRVHTSFHRTIVLLALTVASTGALYAQRVTAQFQGHDVEAKTVLIKFRQPPQNDALAQASISASVEQAKLLADTDVAEAVGSEGWLRFHSRSQDVETLMGLLSNFTDVVGVEPNYALHLDAVPNDPILGDQWGLNNTGQASYLDNGTWRNGTPGADIDAVAAWDISTGTPTIVVGVIDTGIDYNHPDLAANVWSAPYEFGFWQGSTHYTCPAGTHGWNLLNNTCDPINDTQGAFKGHATHVAGTIGATTNNTLGVAGVNWITRIITCKMFDGYGVAAGGNGVFDSDMINCIQFMLDAKSSFGGKDGPADIRVLNNSYGRDGGANQSVLDQINAARKADMLFVASAGNGGNNNDAYPKYPANYAASNVVSVAAFDNVDNIATSGQHDYFSSNYGASTVHLGGPGVWVVSTTPGGLYEFYNGTSMAAPHVSGTGALSLSVCEYDTDLLRPNLLSNVVVTPSLTGKTSTGGRVNAYNSVHAGSLACPGTGYARVTGSEMSRWLNINGQWVLVYDSGTLSLTINGATKTVSYGRYSTASVLAASLRDQIDSDGAHPARAHLSGTNISLSAKTTGANTCYTVSASVTWNTQYFPQASFHISTPGSTLVGCR